MEVRSLGMSGHQSARAQTTEWLTPPHIIEALGQFDLDPCAPLEQPYPTAKRVYTVVDDGLVQDWADARVWLNPPYSSNEVDKWLAKMADHNKGTALIFARTETFAFFNFVWERAHALLFLRGRLHFHFPGGRRASANAGAPSVLCAYGIDDADVLAFCDVPGQFVPLRLPRAVVVKAVHQTWRGLIIDWIRQQDGPVELADLYRAIGRHPRTKLNPHWREQIRKVLQQGPFRRVDRGVWEPIEEGTAA